MPMAPVSLPPIAADRPAVSLPPIVPAPRNFQNVPAPARPDFFSTPTPAKAQGRPFVISDWWARLLGRRRAQTLAGLPPSVDVLLPPMPAVVSVAPEAAGQNAGADRFAAAMSGGRVLAIAAGAAILYTVWKRGRA
jgi:hypothetical protein